MNKRVTSREAADLIIAKLHEAGQVSLLAGGCVRDVLLGLEPKDYDVVTDARPERVVEIFERTEQVGAKFGVVLVRLGGHQIEVATFRADGPYSDGRHPDSVVFGDPLADARRRDFTINGMFMDVVADRVIDHVGGRGDLEAGIVRAIGDPAQRFREDHLRMVRAVRFAARLGFAIEPGTLRAIREQAHLLPAISRERVREELKLILTSPARAGGWELLVSTGLADHVFPGVRFSTEEAGAVGVRLAAIPDQGGFTPALATVLSWLGPGEAASACRALACSNAESNGVAWLLTQLPRVRDGQGLELADVKLLLADERFEDLCALLRADVAVGSASPAAYDDLRARAGAIPAAEVAPPPLVTGEDLLRRRVPQGAIYARVLQALYRAQLNLEITGRVAALARLEALLAEEGV